MIRRGWVVVWLAASTMVGAEVVLREPEFTAASGVKMRMTSAYESLPPLGFAPLRVEVKNPGPSARTWRLRTEHIQGGRQSVAFETSLRVEAGGERTFELLVPLVTQADEGPRYSSLHVNVSGYAVVDPTASLQSSSGGRNRTPFVGIGSELSVPHWAALKEALSKQAPQISLDGTPLDREFLSSDWRAFSGFDIILFTADEWRRTPAGPRQALSEWIDQGGLLVLVVRGAAGDLPPAGPSGCGKILHWPGTANAEAFISDMVGLLARENPLSTDVFCRSYMRNWSMARRVGDPESPHGFMILFVVVFALVVGPLNFFVFAPSGHRHRLFWTTPLISVAGSIVMATVIAVGEGFGGSGERFEAILSLPDRRRAVVWQEQASRTGVLVASDFSLAEPTLLLPIILRRGDQPLMIHRLRTGRYALRDNTWSGDWFRSRSSQTQVLTAVRSDRGRLDVQRDDDGRPTVVSSFPSPLGEVWLVDAGGGVWTAQNLSPGERRALQASDPAAMNRWTNRALEFAGPTIRGRTKQFLDNTPSERFIASTTAPGPIATLPSIRWRNPGGILFGLSAAP